MPNIMSLGICCKKNCTLSNLARLLDTASKFALFSMSGSEDENLTKACKPTRKLKHADSIPESFEHLSQMSSKSVLATACAPAHCTYTAALPKRAVAKD